MLYTAIMVLAFLASVESSKGKSDPKFDEIFPERKAGFVTVDRANMHDRFEPLTLEETGKWMESSTRTEVEIEVYNNLLTIMRALTPYRGNNGWEW